jgi:uncharacterized protein YndB with AHSA1/START domain
MTEQASRLPPVVKQVTVSRPPEAAFRIFTQGLGSWWPFQRYSISQERVKTCGMELHAGGEIFEVRDDGVRLVWGTILVWEPPARLEFTWHPGREPETAQTVEVRFEAIPEGTRVRLEHRNWESLGDSAEEARLGYQAGWEHVFCQCFVEAAA